MIHLKKVNLLRPTVINLFRKAHISQVRFRIPSERKCPRETTALTEIKAADTFNAVTPLYKCDFVANILSEYSNTDSIPWEAVTKKVVDKEVKDSSVPNKSQAINSIILQTCEELKLDSVGISYCKYLLNENKNLSLFNLFLIVKFLFSCGEKITEHKELLKVLRIKLRPYLLSSFSCVTICVRVLCSDYDSWKDLLNSFPSLKDVPPEILSVLAMQAFNFDEYEIGCKIWNARMFPLREQMYVPYLKYCIREAEKGRFSTSLIDNLVERCQKTFSMFPNFDFLPLFKTLVSTLNSDPNKTHIWQVHESSVNNYNVCSKCFQGLDCIKLTEEEFEKLKVHALSDVLINKNIHIKTTRRELSKFLAYLKDKKYDVVMDGLNILHQPTVQWRSNKQKAENFIVKIINHFKKKEMKILFIGRTFITKLPFFKYIQENCEVFLVNSLSDDDAFLIYATLYGGINTHFLTSDFLRGYQLLIEDEEVQIVFRKWNIIRRFGFLSHSPRIMNFLCSIVAEVVDPRGRDVWKAVGEMLDEVNILYEWIFLFIPTFAQSQPKIHCYLPQQTTISKESGGKGDMCWHIPVGCGGTSKMFQKEVVWYCLWRKSLNRKSSPEKSFRNQKMDSVKWIEKLS